MKAYAVALLSALATLACARKEESKPPVPAMSSDIANNMVEYQADTNDVAANLDSASANATHDAALGYSASPTDNDVIVGNLLVPPQQPKPKRPR